MVKRAVRRRETLCSARGIVNHHMMIWFLIIVLLLIIAPMVVFGAAAVVGGILLLLAIFFGVWIGSVYVLATNYPQGNIILDIIIGFVAGVLAARFVFLWFIDQNRV
jgi:hypothetical protein